ncbi:MAG TPA: lytic transglycosylase domain-containing protein, partial [Gammaproteobacteria bacterium]|nr:lytic transglycosylase domain-containing protein [Gammaproteobacteria bacterium]
RQQLYNDYQLLYPRPFNREVRAATRLTGLPGELIYGVLRQESLYRVDAVSSAGALGLLQLLPSTARHTARRWQRPAPAYADLLDPAINIPLGAATLRGHLDRFDGRTTVALAAYNAGPRAARRWLPPTEMEADIWVENIPYNETRSYVQRVLWHSLVFAWLRDDAPQNAAAWLKPITPDLEIPTRVADVAR